MRDEFNRFMQWWIEEGKKVFELHDGSADYDAAFACAWHAWSSCKEVGDE